MRPHGAFARWRQGGAESAVGARGARRGVCGETACRPLSPCEEGLWGTIPVDVSTIYVDGAFEGTSDGSSDAPWTQIQDALDAAPSGALIAVAAGTYAENLTIATVDVTLWGVCPDEVIIDAPGAGPAIFLGEGSTLRGVTVTGPSYGVVADGVDDVFVDRVHVVDTGVIGIVIVGDDGSVTESLVENAVEAGVVVEGSGTLSRTTVRDTRPRPDGTFGVGVLCQPPAAGASTLTVEGSVLEGNADAAILAGSADVTVEGTLIRQTRAGYEGGPGHGLSIQAGTAAAPSHCRATATVIEDSVGMGINVVGASIELDAVVVRRAAISLPDPEPRGGHGFGAYEDPATGQPSSATIRRSLFEEAARLGLFARGSELSLDRVIVRDVALDSEVPSGEGVCVEPSELVSGRGRIAIDRSIFEDIRGNALLLAGVESQLTGVRVSRTLPSVDGTFGRGINVNPDLETFTRPVSEIRWSLVEDSFDLGLFIAAADVLVENVHVRRVEAQSALGIGGFGIGAQWLPANGAEAAVTLRDVVVEDVTSTGVVAFGSGVTVERSTITGVRPTPDGLFGDGIGAMTFADHPAVMSLSGVLLEDNARAGVASFGAAIDIADTTSWCNPIDINAQTFVLAANLTDGGGNRCGCGDQERICTATSAELAPPEPR